MLPYAATGRQHPNISLFHSARCQCHKSNPWAQGLYCSISIAATHATKLSSSNSNNPATHTTQRNSRNSTQHFTGWSAHASFFFFSFCMMSVRNAPIGSGDRELLSAGGDNGRALDKIGPRPNRSTLSSDRV